MIKKASIYSKYEQVKHIIRPYGNVAVAYSGGVDSSLLLYASIEVLGSSNVTALHGRSCLNISEDEIEELHRDNFKQHNELIILEVEPLNWPEFIANDSLRCYYCKKKTYKMFKKFLTDSEYKVLLDGTNADDLLEERAGLTVLKEMEVKTPLAEAGLSKKDVRFLAQSFNLSNYRTPSNSCLATRLSSLPAIDPEKLKIVERIEHQLKKMGFSGCRAKPSGDTIIIEIRQQDYIKIVRKHNRIIISDICDEHGITKILLDLKGRH